MNSISNIFLELNNYFTGDVVKGSLRFPQQGFSRTKGIMLKEISIRMVGRAKVHWSEFNEKSKFNLLYGNQQIYIDENKLLFSSTEGEGRTERLEEFPFTFTLPSEIPSSFEGPHGTVKYYLDTTIKGLEEGKPFVQRERKVIQVNEITDLNLDLGRSSAPISFQEETHTFCLCYSQSGSATLDFYCPKTGYIPGECLKFSTDVFNGTADRIGGPLVILQREIVLKALLKVTSYKEDIAICKGPYVNPGDYKRWEGKLGIPLGLPPSNSRASNIINVYYRLKVELGLSLTSKIRRNPSVLIGNIPVALINDDGSPFESGIDFHHAHRFRDFQSQQLQNGSVHSSDELPTYFQLEALPTYEEAVLCE